MNRFTFTKLRRVMLLAAIASVFLAGCAGGGKIAAWSGTPVHGTVTDSRDGSTYRTVTISNQTWLAENLRYVPASGKSWCYGNDSSNCDKYGRLYNWGTAMKACPSGWHLPSKKEWLNLNVDVAKLRASSGWDGNGNGTDEYGFSALPGGKRALSGFREAGERGYWWSGSRGLSPGNAGFDAVFFLWLFQSEQIVLGSKNKGGKVEVGGNGQGCSVRCIQDK